MNVAICRTGKAGIEVKVTEQHIEMIKSALPGAQVYVSTNGFDLIEQGIKAEVLIGLGSLFFDSEEYCNFTADRLKWINVVTAGTEGIEALPIAKLPGLKLTNARGIHSIPMAEHVLGYLLWYYRNLEYIRESQRMCAWRKFVPQELYGRTVAVVGAGTIGREIALRCKAFGTKIIAVDQNTAPVPGADEVVHSDQLNSVLTRADIVITILPLTKGTENLFNADKFAQMKPTALFINVGRGGTTDTQALTDALTEKRIAGAMVDVLEPSPLPSDHPLWKLDNVFISPHISSNSPKYMDRAFEVFCQQAECYIANKPMPNEIPL